jgi:hypothetical protein
MLARRDDNVSREASSSRGGVVGDEEATQQGLSGPRGKLNWSEMLRNSGLETPGYHETVQQMKKEGRIRNKKSG